LNKHDRSRWTMLVAALPYAWLVVFFLVPFLIVLKISFSQSAIALPPYTPVFDVAAGWRGIVNFLSGLSFDNYRLLGSDPLYLVSYVKSVEIAAFSTLLLLIVGYPIAYAITRTPKRLQAMLVVLVVLPFWTSFLIRIYAWMNILQRDGPLAQLLLEAAADLGCPRWKTFWLVTLPLSAPGVVAGVLLCFIPIVGEFVIPDLLGGSQTPMIGQTIWMEFFGNKDWPTASAVAVVLVCLLVTPIVVFQHQALRAADRD
jgi:putrescine transport system permease protein